MKRFASQHKHKTYKQKTDSTLSFNLFTFTDKLTNNKISLKDAHEQYQHPAPSNSPLIHQNKNNKENNTCMDMLKSTKFFQMQSLKSKLFKSAHQSRNPTLNIEDLSAKKEMKSMIEKSVREINRKEFQCWLTDTSKRINPQVMNLSVSGHHKVTKADLLKVMSNHEKVIEEQPKHMLPTFIEDIPVEMKGEKELRQKIEHNLTSIRSHNSHLVRPNPHHELYERLYTACNGKQKRLKKARPSEIKVTPPDEGVFRPIRAGERIDALQKKLLSTNKVQQSAEEKELINAVENNLFFDMEMILATRSHLINCKDKNGNNLLHIATKCRNQQFFEFILKRTGSQALKSKNNLGKTPKDIAKLYGVEGIVTFINNYPVY